MEENCEKLHNTVKRHEEMIKGLALNISELQTEIEYMNELINALSESVENNYFKIKDSGNLLEAPANFYFQ